MVCAGNSATALPLLVRLRIQNGLTTGSTLSIAMAHMMESAGPRLIFAVLLELRPVGAMSVSPLLRSTKRRRQKLSDSRQQQPGMAACRACRGTSSKLDSRNAGGNIFAGKWRAHAIQSVGTSGVIERANPV